jgi:hypothetical protein
MSTFVCRPDTPVQDSAASSNLSDGVLGQGFNTLILVTTNEGLGQLHPALVRPGRCLARVEFSPMAPAEAREWLPSGINAPTHPVSLAELFERNGEVTRIRSDHSERGTTGQYL